MYCQNCGTKLNDTAKFCPECGNQARDAVQPSVTQPESAGVERAMMVLNVSRKDGLFKRSTVFMVFFKDRVVLAELTGQRQKDESRVLSEKIKEEKKGFFAGSQEMMNYWANYGNKYYNMTPAEILAEERVNMEVFHQDVSRFTFKRYELQSDNNGSTQTGGDLEVIHRLGKLKASHKYSDSNHNIMKVLEPLYGSSLKYRGTKVLFSIGHGKGFI